MLALPNRTVDSKYLLKLAAMLYASMGGTVGFACSDGRAATVPFQAFSALSGAGRIRAGAGEFALTYGLAPDKAAGYLGVAADRLVRPGGS